jgi:hypothetical protein
MTRFTRSANGKYVVQSKSYEVLIGTRAQVWHGTAYKTSGGLTKNDLLQNKNGRIVSKAKHSTAKKENRLVKSGYGTKKGVFGFVKLNGKTKSTRGGAGNMGSGNMGSGSSGMGSKMSGNSNSNSSGSSNMMKMAAVKNMGAKQSGGVGNMGSSGNMGSKMSGNSNSNSNSSGSSNMMKMAAVKNMGGNKSGGRRSRRGGSGMNALSPSSFSGKGVGTSGVDLQFIAGNAA